VGIGWLTKSRDINQRQPEAEYEVDVAAQAVFQKVRGSATRIPSPVFAETNISHLEEEINGASAAASPDGHLD
jgi:hypothetical protein